jgi:hypothetical protein
MESQLVAKNPKISITFFQFVEKAIVYQIKGIHVSKAKYWVKSISAPFGGYGCLNSICFAFHKLLPLI